MAVLLFISSCNQPVQKKKVRDKDKFREFLMERNKYHTQYEEQDILDFLKRYKWPVQETGTGLRYYIYEQGRGLKIKNSYKVTYHYEIRFLNGNLVYQSLENQPKSMVMPGGDVTDGLLEAFKQLREGDKAKIIIPSHLAHGVAGDGKRIPPYATLVYDIQILKVQKPLN